MSTDTASLRARDDPPGEELLERADEIKGMSRSERVEALFQFEPFDWQEGLLDSDHNEKVVRCGRQVGKTETGGAIGADGALRLQNQDVMFASVYRGTAKEMMTRAKKHLMNTGLDPERLGVVKDNAEMWTFANGTRMYVASLNPSSGVDGEAGSGVRGRLPKIALIDEAALVRDETYEKVIEPMFATHDDYEIVLFSTPRGKSGYFYEASVDARTDQNRWREWHVPTEESPLVDEEWLEQRKASNDRRTWEQEYLGLFTDEGEVLIPVEIYDPCVADSEPYRDPNEAVYMGVDVARRGEDRTVYLLMDASGTVFEVLSEEESSIDEVAGRIKALDERHGCTKIYIDENAVGGGVVDFVSKGLGGKVEPQTFSTKNKHRMYTELVRAFEEGELELPDHDRMRRETTRLQFSYTQTGKLGVSHPEGGHDDFPDALAQAAYARKKHGGSVMAFQLGAEA